MSTAEVKFESQGVTLESNLETVKLAVDYLNGFTDKSELIRNSRAYEAITFLYQIIGKHCGNGDALIELLTERNFLQLTQSIFEHYAEICSSLVNCSTGTYGHEDSYKQYFLAHLLETLNYLTIYSLKMRIKMFEIGGAKVLLKILDNDEFEQKFREEDLFTRIVANLNWMSKVAEMFKTEWAELNAVDVFLKISKSCPKSKLIAYMTFANVANDKQIDSSPDIHKILPELIDIVHRGAKTIAAGGVSREKHPFLEEDEATNQQYDVYVVPVPQYNTRFTITGVLLALYKLSVNNNIKYDMYMKYNLKEPLANIIYKGTEIEKKYSVQVLAQLCFDHLVLDMVARDDELKSCIESMTKPENCSMKTMRKLCEQVSWAIAMSNKKESNEADHRGADDVHQQKQIMVSYNSGSRDLCLKIKEELEKNNFKVWIDVNEIHGSSLDAMARAVESSDFILMCVTEKYRQSVNCQAEAQYAFKLKKKIIPLIMQKGYENVDGWLGIIMGDKIFVNFNKYPFEQCVTLILKDISLNLSSVSKQPVKQFEESFSKVTVSAVFEKPHVDVTTTIKSWSEKQVDDWLSEKKVPEQIQSMLKPCNGEVLYQLHKLRTGAPEFYYQSLSKNSNLDLKALLLFSNDLEKLFEDK